MNIEVRGTLAMDFQDIQTSFITCGLSSTIFHLDPVVRGSYCHIS